MKQATISIIAISTLVIFALCMAHCDAQKEKPVLVSECTQMRDNRCIEAVQGQHECKLVPINSEEWPDEMDVLFYTISVNHDASYCWIIECNRMQAHQVLDYFINNEQSSYVISITKLFDDNWQNYEGLELIQYNDIYD